MEEPSVMQCIGEPTEPTNIVIFGAGGEYKFPVFYAYLAGVKLEHKLPVAELTLYQRPGQVSI